MKTCIFIIGTNCVGKTTLAKGLINKFGGIRDVTNNITFSNDGTMCLAGRYSDSKRHGGVDKLNSTKGLKEVVRTGLLKCDTIVCEGSFLDTFGMNLTNAMFVAERYIVVFLYAPLQEINKRLIDRSGNNITEEVIKKQQNCLRSAKKWASIGVPVLSFDTSKYSVNNIEDKIIERINKL